MITMYLLIKFSIDLILFIPRMIIRTYERIAFPTYYTKSTSIFKGAGTPIILGAILGVLTFPFRCIKPFNKNGVKW